MESGRSGSKIKERVKSLCLCLSSTSYRDELKDLLKIAWPIVLTQIFQILVLVVSFAFCGHISKKSLDAVALATTIVNISGNSVINGLASAMDTLFSQTYGSSNKHNLGVILQKGILILMLACLPCWSVFMNAEHILLLAGQDPVVAYLSGWYATIFMAALPGTALFVALAKYLQSQTKVFPSMLIGASANVVNIILLCTFLFGLKMGVKGAAIAVSLTQWYVAGAHVLYIWYSGIYKTTWSGWSTQCLQKWGTFTSLAVPGLIMLCLEWWSYEIILFVVGKLGVLPLASHTILYVIAGLVYMLPLGLSFASSIRVGTLLGANNPERSQIAARVSVFVAVCTGVITCVVLFCLKDLIPRIFTDEHDVLQRTSSLFPQLALFELTDCIQCTSSGIIRGIGHQLFGAVVNIGTYYLIALPIAIPLLLATNVGVAGAWYGSRSGSFFLAVVYFIKIAFINWQKEADDAQARVQVTTKKNINENNHSDTQYETIGQIQESDNRNDQFILSEDLKLVEESGNREAKLSSTDVCKKMIAVGAFVLILFASVVLRIYLDHRVRTDPACGTVPVQVLDQGFITSIIEHNTTSPHFQPTELKILKLTYDFEKPFNWTKSFVYCYRSKSIEQTGVDYDWPLFKNIEIFSNKSQDVANYQSKIIG